MKRMIGFLVAVSVCLTVIAPMSSCKSVGSDKVINIFNWGQYIADGEDGCRDIVKEFEQKTGYRVNYTTYESNEAMYAKLISGGASYDLIVPSDYMAARLIAENRLEKINFDNIPNIKNVDESYLEMYYDKTGEYTVPYTCGTVGIIYNKKYVKEKIDSWSSLWNPKYSDNILMFSNPRDAMAIAESLLGIDPNTTSEKDMKRAAKKLEQQKPLLQEYVMDQIFDKMINETAWIAPYYAGDYLTMKADNDNLEFCFPKEGFNRFLDCMCIPKGCGNKEGAEAFINFILDKDIQFANVDYIGYSSPFKLELIPEDYVDDLSYPDAKTLTNSFVFENLPKESLQMMDDIWTSVRAS